MFKNRVCRGLVLMSALALSSNLAKAAVLFSADVSISASDPTQLGRLSRNGIAQDWAFSEPFPGVVNPATSYHYLAISVFVPNWLSFLQISLDSENVNIFGSAYDSAYVPVSGLNVNFLGDAGFSGNAFGNPIFFQVVAQTASVTPSGGYVVIVLNETSTNGAGLNSPVGLVVEGFSDTEFNETAPTVPEPSTYLFLGSGSAALLVLNRRRRTTH
jgi:hypothetical protein